MKDAAAFQNIHRILALASQGEQLLLVVSAMGKTTNALEVIFHQAHQQQDFSLAFQSCKDYHFQILQELFPDPAQVIFTLIEEKFRELEDTLQHLLPDRYDQQYDQIISYGEILSSLILHHYLRSQGFANTWIDSRKYLRTDTTWREGKLDWTWTERLIQHDLPGLLQEQPLVTQGFLGGSAEGATTTLGREGSDFSAAIFAYCLRAQSLTIWKDVPGVLNADPKLFPDTVLYDQIAYQEAIEMSYYGASVIHPKTIQPLANRGIPLYVKSFLHPLEPGTVIHNCLHERIAPAFILKQQQCLLSFHTKDFGFITENNLSTIFQALSEWRIKINLMQNSAISFSICTDFHELRIQQLVQSLSDEFVILYNQPLHLFTIKNYDQESILKLTEGREILLEQRTRNTFQFVCRPAGLPL